MTDDSSLPDSTPNPTPAASAATNSPTTDSPANARTIAGRPDHVGAAPHRSRTRTLLIAGGGVLAAAVLAGGGIAVGAAIADETDGDDDDRSSSRPASDDRADDDPSDDDTSGAAQSGVRGSDSADELKEIIAAASESADGEAVGIEAEPDGSWDVQFQTGAGDETDVRVTADGTTEVISTGTADAGDSPAQGVLDVQTVDALVAAALAEVDGEIVDIEIDDDNASPFDVSVLQADRSIIELTLDTDMTVLTSDRT